MINRLFAPKVRKTQKLDCLNKFWNGSLGRAQKGLEVSLIALIDTAANRAFALSAEQTPAADVAAAGSETRMDFYLRHFERTVPRLPASVKYLLVDGCYAKEKFVSSVCAADYEVISRLRSDANLRFLYRGEQRAGRGRPRKFDGKVNLSDLSRFEFVESPNKQLSLYTERVWSVSLKRELRVPALVNRHRTDQGKNHRLVFNRFGTGRQTVAAALPGALPIRVFVS